MEENLLLTVDFNNDDIQDAIKNISDGRKKIDELVEANKKLAAQGQKNSKEYITNQEAIKALNSEVNANSKIVQANTQANKVNADSLEALRIKNAALRKERNALSKDTDEGRKRIAEINAELDKNNDILTENSSKQEKQNANIGNYQSALSKVSPELGNFVGSLQGMTSGLKGTEGGFKASASAAGGLLKAALPLLAIVTIFKTLQTFLTGSTAGMDKLEDITTSISAVFNVLVDRVTKFVGGIGKLLSGDFKSGLSDISNSFSGIGDEIQREINLTLELNEAIRSLEDAEINYDIQASKTANTIKTLLLQSKNRTLSEQERIKLLTQASKLEEEQSNQLIKNRAEALRIANDEASMRVDIARISGESEADFAQRILDTGLLLDDQRDKVKDTVIAFNNAIGESISVQEKIQNQRDALEEKAAADAAKRAEERKKQLEEIAKKQEEIAKREQTAANQLALLQLEAEAKRIQGAEMQADKLIEIEQLRAEQLLANAELLESERQIIKIESEEKINEILAQSRERQQQEVEQALAGELEAYKEYVQGLVNAEKEKLLSGVISQEEYDEEISNLQIAALETELAIKTHFGDQDLVLAGRISDAKIAQSQHEAEEVKKNEQLKVDAVQNTLGQVAGLFNKNSVAFKALASAQTLIQTYQSAQSVFTGMTQTIPGPVGIALGVAGAIAATIAGIARVNQINSTKTPKLAEGGMMDIQGPLHSHGGVDVHVGGKRVANVEGGEKLVVLKRGASPLLRSLSNINQLVGGVDFFNNRAPVRMAADGGMIARTASNPVSGFNQRSANEVLKNSKTYLRITDLHRVENNADFAKVTSELS